jgi:hypothetical protein
MRRISIAPAAMRDIDSEVHRFRGPRITARRDQEVKWQALLRKHLLPEKRCRPTDECATFR